MVTRFEFATATRIVFGCGAASEIVPAALAIGKRALLITGRNLERTGSLQTLLQLAGVDCTRFSVAGEPTVGSVRDGVQQARQAQCDVVIAYGGGSVIDAGKAVAALLPNGDEPLDYLEVIGAGKPLVNPSLPLITVPTTAGTGSEVTRNAVLGSPEHGMKASLRSPFMLPRLAVVDPELTFSLPPALTASTGLDALTQLIEPYVSVRANPITDALCRDGLTRAAIALRRAYKVGSDVDARVGMSCASLFGGLALANAALGAVHGFAAPIGGMFDAPHGAVCAALLPHATLVNIRALRARAKDPDGIQRYETVGSLLTGSARANADDAVEWLSETCRSLNIPPLREYGVSQQHVTDIVGKAARASSMKGNPIVLTEKELSEILSLAI
jgi:alcohol dehydrogenase class IV